MKTLVTSILQSTIYPILYLFLHTTHCYSIVKNYNFGFYFCYISKETGNCDFSSIKTTAAYQIYRHFAKYTTLHYAESSASSILIQSVSKEQGVCFLSVWNFSSDIWIYQYLKCYKWILHIDIFKLSWMPCQYKSKLHGFTPKKTIYLKC